MFVSFNAPTAAEMHSHEFRVRPDAEYHYPLGQTSRVNVGQTHDRSRNLLSTRRAIASYVLYGRSNTVVNIIPRAPNRSARDAFIRFESANKLG